jgi:hypothetical protein
MISTNAERDREAKVGQQGAGPKNDVAYPDVGRIAVTCPKRGELNIYCKRDGFMGAKVVCADGTAYGVSPKVRERFPKIGVYAGWAFADERRSLVFRFVVGDVSVEPERLHVIDTATGCVFIPARRLGGRSFENGSLVAFTWQYARRNGKEKAKCEATSVHPLDAKHLSLISQLIANNKLLFPSHAEVLGVFLEGLAACGVSAQDTSQVSAALGKLAADPGVPAHLQKLARVERTQLLSAEPSAVGRSSSQRQPAVLADGKTNNEPRCSRAASVVATDVTQMKLFLD